MVTVHTGVAALHHRIRLGELELWVVWGLEFCKRYLKHNIVIYGTDTSILVY